MPMEYTSTRKGGTFIHRDCASIPAMSASTLGKDDSMQKRKQNSAYQEFARTFRTIFLVEMVALVVALLVK